MRLLSLLVFAFASQSVVLGALLGANKCTYGPSYWCASFENAKECSATQHCLQNNWVTAGKPAYVREETMCTFCKDMVNDVHEFVTSNTNQTKALVESYLERACGYMPDEFSTAQCKKITTHYLDEFIALVDQNIDAGVICSLLKLCPESRRADSRPVVARRPAVARKPVHKPITDNGTVCTKCKEIVNKIHSFVLNNSATAEAMARQYLNETCALMPDDFSKAECLKIGEHYISEVMALITAGVDAEMICSLFHLCHNDTKPVIHSLQIKVKDETPCQLCKDIAASVQEFVKNNSATARAKASAYINKVCDRCTDDFGNAECKKIGEHYLDELIAMVEAGVNPDIICSLFHLCNGTSSQPTMVKDETPCELCKDIAASVQGFVKNNSATARAKASAYINKVCDRCTDDFGKAECKKIGEHYLDELIAMVEAGVNPDIICSLFHLCNGTSSQPTMVKDETPCQLCKNMVDDVRHFVVNDSATAEAKALEYLDQICAKIPDEFAKGECENIGKHYMDVLMDLIKTGIDADVICGLLGLCESNGPILRKFYMSNGTVCAMCKQVVNKLHQFLLNNSDSAKAQAEQYLKQTCHLMPDDFSRAECKKIGEHYIEAVIALLKAGVDAQKICSLFHLCNSEARLAQVKVKDETPCQLCKDMVNEVRQFVTNDSATARAKALEYIDQICEKIPDEYAKGECEKVATHYLDTLIAMIKSGLDPDVICSFFKLCLNNARAVSVKDETPCELCKDIAASVQGFVKNNSATARAKASAYINKVCDRCPDDFGKAECKKIGEHYLDELIAMVEAGVNPDIICSLFHLCNGTSSQPTMVKDTPECEECKKAEQSIRTWVDNKDNQKKMADFLQAQCMKMGGDMAAECQTIVAKVLPELITLVDTNLNGQLCTALHICHSSVDVIGGAQQLLTQLIENSGIKQHIAQLASRTGKDMCAECEEVFTYVALFLKNNVSQAQIEQMVENSICSKLGFFASVCKREVNEHFPEIWAQVLADMDPKKICVAVKLCNASSVAAPKPKPKSISPECIICEFLLHELESHFLTNSTEEVMKAALDKACSELPADWAAKCDAFVNNYGVEIIELLIEKVAPEAVCTLIGACLGDCQRKLAEKKVDMGNCVMCEMAVAYLKSSLAQDSTEALNRLCDKLPANLAHQVKDTPECEECKKAEQSIRTWVDNKDNQKKMADFLQAQCMKMGGDMAAECQTIVAKVLPAFITFIDTNLNGQLCTALHICHSSVDVIGGAQQLLTQLIENSGIKQHIAQLASRTGTDICTECEEVFNYIHIFLRNNASQAQVEKAIEDYICSQLGEFSGLCQGAVHDYFPQIWAELIRVLDPKKVCIELRMCNATSQVEAQPQAQPSISVECVLCEFVLHELESKYITPKTEEELDADLEKICDALPHNMSVECHQLANKYGVVIIKLLLAEVAPETICAIIHICPGETQHKLAEKKVDMGNCIMCEMAVAYLKSSLAKNATEAQLTAALNRLCDKLPANLAHQCGAMVEQYGPTMFKLIGEDITSGSVCTAVGLCQSEGADGLVHLDDRSSNV